MTLEILFSISGANPAHFLFFCLLRLITLWHLIRLSHPDWALKILIELKGTKNIQCAKKSALNNLNNSQDKEKKLPYQQ